VAEVARYPYNTDSAEEVKGTWYPTCKWDVGFGVTVFGESFPSTTGVYSRPSRLFIIIIVYS